MKADEFVAKKVCILVNGCPENRNDGARMQDLFKENGWSITGDYRDADIILFNACGLTQDSENGSMRTIDRLKAGKKASAELVVWGCLPKINENRLREVYTGPTFGSDDIEHVAKILTLKPETTFDYADYLLPLVGGRGLPPLTTILSPLLIPRLLTRFFGYRNKGGPYAFGPDTFCIKVSTGCLGACSYCAVRNSRGRLRSRPLEDIAHDFDEGLRLGFEDFALMGTDTAAYGRDRGLTLVSLLNEFLKRNGNYRIRLRNMEPRFLIEMMPDLRAIFRSGKISYLSTGVESGSNRVLRLMNRLYRIEDLREAILELNQEFPRIALLTQIMVGFPGETEQDFQDTVRLLDEVKFNTVEVYPFQARPNTRAATMENTVPKKVARRRCLKLFVRSLFREYQVLVW